ncbi:hypothetical protein SAMN05720759_104125 [Fibrobacter sp. UWB12]|nr:hypothetical protein SAMN05720759_104125 [Fibrobacter sp. UWB12]
MSHKRPVSTGRVGERTSHDFFIAMWARPVFIPLQVRVLAPAEEKVSRKTGLFCFLYAAGKHAENAKNAPGMLGGMQELHLLQCHSGRSPS